MVPLHTRSIVSKRNDFKLQGEKTPLTVPDSSEAGTSNSSVLTNTIQHDCSCILQCSKQETTVVPSFIYYSLVAGAVYLQ